MSAIVETAAKGRREAGVDQAEQRGHVGPPRPRMAFRVGVVGHRPDRLDEAIADPLELQRVIRAILETIKNQTLTAWRDYRANYSDDEPLLTAISALAEGTDRLFAEAALEVGFALACVLPFPSDEYAKDFAENSDSLLQYRELLARASSSFELDGMRDDDVDAYGTCGRVVLNQSDLLVVVWDGQRRHRGGGTEDTLEYAVSRGVPVAWIDAHAPHHWQLIDERSGMPRAPKNKAARPDGSKPSADIRGQVRQILKLPEVPQGHGRHDRASTRDPQVGLNDFYAERQPRWSIAVFWAVFLQIVAFDRNRKVSYQVAEFKTAVAPQWPSDRSTTIGRLIDDLQSFHAWADQLAVLCANRYRSTYVVAYVLAAAAVGLALVPLATDMSPRAESICLVLELVTISTILVIVKIGDQMRWHQRWLDYRLTAELIRHLRLVAPLCGQRPFLQIPAHWVGYGQPAASWMAWYARAVERALELPSTVVDKAYLKACLSQLDEVVKGQMDYHHDAAPRTTRPS